MKSILENIKKLLASKKFKVLLASLAGLALSVWSGQLGASEALSAAWPLVLAYLGAQGLSDAFGKGKLEAEAEAKPAPADAA
jgi:cation transporter-like permease